jgi:hypothetical protein
VNASQDKITVHAVDNSGTISRCVPKADLPQLAPRDPIWLGHLKLHSLVVKKWCTQENRASLSEVRGHCDVGREVWHNQDPEPHLGSHPSSQGGSYRMKDSHPPLAGPVTLYCLLGSGVVVHHRAQWAKGLKPKSSLTSIRDRAPLTLVRSASFIVGSYSLHYRDQTPYGTQRQAPVCTAVLEAHLVRLALQPSSECRICRTSFAQYLALQVLGGPGCPRLL